MSKIYNKKFINFLRFLPLVIPGLVFAQFRSGVVACDLSGGSLLGADFSCTIQRIIDLLGIIYPILISLAFLMFSWGVAKFILKSDNKIEIQKGKSYMIWGIVVIFVLVTVRVIIGIVSNEFFGTGTTPTESGILLPTL